jgi:hypothetical protein
MNDTNTNGAAEKAALALSLYIENANNSQFGGFTIPLPTTADSLRPFLEDIEVVGWQDIKIWEATSELGSWGDAVTEAFKKSLSPDTLNELNYLAALISDMSEEERVTFSAIVLAGWHVGSMTEIINTAQNLDAFYHQPAYNARDYGEFLVDMLRDDTALSYLGLEKSQDEGDRDLAKFINRLENAVDYTRFGRLYAAEEKGVFTEAGYITEVGEYKESYRDPEDIPSEYHVYIPSSEPFIKLEHIDLTTLLMKMHALGGEYMHDVRHNVNTLEQRFTDEYLLLMTERSLYLFDAADAYYLGTPAYDAILNAVGAGTNVFALHVADTSLGKSVGDLVGLSLAALQADIQQHGVQFDRIDAVQRFGPDLSFTPEQWERTDEIDRNMLESWERHYIPEEVGALRTHLETVRDAHIKNGDAASQDAFLGRLNSRYMKQSGCSQPDMLRIPRDVAKELLAGGAAVFQLTAGGFARLSPIESIRGKVLDRAESVTVIPKNEMPALDRWAERKAGDFLRWQDRTGHEKSYNNEL